MHAADRYCARLPVLLLLVLLPALAAGQEPEQDRLELKSVTYSPQISRDPFAIPDFDAEAVARPTAQLNLLEGTLVGIVTATGLRFALVEDLAGEGYTLLEGDPVYKGRVTRIGDEFLEAVIYTNLMEQHIRLELVKEGD